MPFLRHESFKDEMVCWMRNIIRSCSEFNIPHHQPTALIVEGKARTIASCLHNSKEFVAGIAIKGVPECCCHILRHCAPASSYSAEGHLCTDFTSLGPSDMLTQDEHDLLTASSKEAVYRDRKTAALQFIAGLTRYFKDNCVAIGMLGAPQDFNKCIMDIFRAQWKKHEEALKVAPAHTMATIESIQTKLAGLIFQCEDHAYTRTLVFCPVQYYIMVQRTFFEETKVFTRIRLSVESAFRTVKDSLPDEIRKGCKWAFRNQDPNKVEYIPVAYLIPKRKKAFAKGRPVVPCPKHWLVKLHRTAGRLIADLSQQVFHGRSFDVPTTMKAVQELSTFRNLLENRAIFGNLVIFNRDLAGFFTSIPRESIIKSVQMMLEQAVEMRAQKWQSKYWWTVSITGPRRPSLPGKHHFQGAIHISAEMLLSIVEHSFQVALFQIAGRVFEQTRGALIGFPTSAALCITTVMISEMRLLNRIRLNQSRLWLAMRYVDNLVTLDIRKKHSSTLPDALKSAFFYGETVVLEYEADFGYLGLRIIPTQRSFQLEVIVPGYDEVEGCYPYPPSIYQDKWRYRTSQSAGSMSGLITGFQSRLCNAARYGLPKSRAREAIAKLFVIALITGQDQLLLRRLLKRHRKKFKRVYTDQFAANLKGALGSTRSTAIAMCQKLVGSQRSDH